MKRKFLVVYAKSPGSNFSGQAPDVTGCVSVGDTLDEMRSMMREALEFHFEGMLEDSEKIPRPSTTSVDFKPEDFDDAEYFVVEYLEVNVPVKLTTPEAISAA